MAAGKQLEQGAPSPGASFTRQFRESASLLAQSAFTNPFAANNILASVSDQEMKTGASSSAESRDPGCIIRGSLPLEKGRNEGHLLGCDDFRTTSDQLNEEVQAEYEDFLRTNRFPNETLLSSLTHADSLAQRRSDDSRYLSDSGETIHNSSKVGINASEYQAILDGSAVVELLSQPGLPSEKEPCVLWTQSDSQKLSQSLTPQASDIAVSTKPVRPEASSERSLADI